MEERPLKNGDIFDIGQTVNGQSEFVMIDTVTMDVRYNYDRSKRYEYSVAELIAPCRWTGEQSYKIIGSIN